MIDLAPAHLATVKRILSELVPDCEVRAFGSRVTWTAKDYSDLDLAIVSSRALDRDTMRRLKDAFEESDLPIRVDVIDYRAISESFRKIVDDNCEVVQKVKSRDSDSKRPSERLGGKGVNARWLDTTIGELLSKNGGSVKTGPFSTILKAKEYSKEGVPLISVGEVGYGSLNVGDRTPRVSREVVERLPEYVLEVGDIVFGRKGSVDRSAFIKVEHAGWFLGSDGIRLRLPNTCDSRFIAYQLQSPQSRSWLIQHATGTTMASLNQSIIERLPIVLPPLPDQRAIAHILGTLDDKIELNRRMNETLEAMARALFKSWFVDFDPVRAKAAGRQPTGMDDDTAKLFPREFVNSELGEIPKGWEVKTLRDIVSYINRGISPIYVDLGGTCVLNQKCIRDHRIDFSLARRHDSSKKSAEDRVLRELDILVNSTGVGTLGRVAQLWQHPEHAIVDSHITVVRAADNVDPRFLGITLITRESDIEVLGEGSTGQTELNRNRLGELPCLIPSRELQQVFGRFTAPLLSRITCSERESRSLTATRDALLPRLASGEVRIGDNKYLNEGDSR